MLTSQRKFSLSHSIPTSITELPYILLITFMRKHEMRGGERKGNIYRGDEVQVGSVLQIEVLQTKADVRYQARENDTVHKIGWDQSATDHERQRYGSPLALSGGRSGRSKGKASNSADIRVCRWKFDRLRLTLA
jgi:hypothetical protein